MHLMNPPLAKRRNKTPDRQHRQQRLPCPACECERLIDTGIHTRSKTFVLARLDMTPLTITKNAIVVRAVLAS